MTKVTWDQYKEAVLADEVTLQVTGEAAAINHVADVIGEWADRKGFREDWDDADFLDKLSDELPDSAASAALRLTEIAEKHRRLANVQKLMLMVSEASEALGDLRDGYSPDSHAYGEELADIIIRVLENAHCNRQPIGDIVIAKVDKNQGRPHKHGKHF